MGSGPSPAQNLRRRMTSYKKLTHCPPSRSLPLLDFFTNLRSDPNEFGSEPLNRIHRINRVPVERIAVGLEVNRPDQTMTQLLSQSFAQRFSRYPLAVHIKFLANSEIDAQSFLPGARIPDRGCACTEINPQSV